MFRIFLNYWNGSALKNIKIAFILFVSVNIASIADTIYFPVYSPDSTVFFSSEIQNAAAADSKWNFYATFFENGYGTVDTGQKYENDIKGVMRLAGSTGAIIPVWKYLSVIGHFTYINDDAEIAKSRNFFTGGGIISNYSDSSFGVFAGYYNNKNTTYNHVHVPAAWGQEAYWTWKEDTTTELEDVKFTITPKFGLSRYISFIDEISGYFNFNKYFDVDQLLAKLAFTAFQSGASRIGINIYYKQEPYNLVTNQQLIGGSFETEYIKIDTGYRRFVHLTDINLYKDGLYGRIIGKIPINKSYLWLSTSIERGINWIPMFGIGYQLWGGVQALVEMGYNEGLGVNGFVHVNAARMNN